jgi:hypothetical protein
MLVEDSMSAIPSKTWLVAALVCAPLRAASGQNIDEPVHLTLPPTSGLGLQLSLGGGVTQFTNRTMRDTTSPLGGQWDLRAVIGTRIPIGIEIGYLGSAAQIRSLFSQTTAVMVGTTIESDLRLNILPSRIVDPYIFAGLGWTRYNVDEPAFTLATTGIRTHDDMMEVPAGAGVAFRWDGVVADLRGTFHATDGSQLVLDENSMRATTGQFAAMHSWDATLAVGYEF